MAKPRTLRLIAKMLKALKSPGGLTQPATLTLFTKGTATPGAVSAGNNPTPTDYACHVMPSDEVHENIGGTLVEKTDIVWNMYGAMIASGAQPKDGSKLIVDGVPYRVISFTGKGAGAVYIVLTRK